jgi:hypothetical protein
MRKLCGLQKAGSWKIIMAGPGKADQKKRREAKRAVNSRKLNFH